MPFFDFSLPQILIVLIVGLVVFGPERLPDLAAKAAHGVRSLRVLASKAMSDLNVETAAVTRTIADLQSLTPRAIVSDVVSSVVGEQSVAARPTAAARPVPPAAATQAVRAVFDPDAT